MTGKPDNDPAALDETAPEDSGERARAAAAALPVLGLVLFLPPIVGVFATDDRMFGAPAPVIYVFAVWAGLIASAALLSRALRGDGADDGA